MYLLQCEGNGIQAGNRGRISIARCLAGRLVSTFNTVGCGDQRQVDGEAVLRRSGRSPTCCGYAVADTGIQAAIEREWSQRWRWSAIARECRWKLYG